MVGTIKWVHIGLFASHSFDGHDENITLALGNTQIQTGQHLAMALSKDLEYSARVDGSIDLSIPAPIAIDEKTIALALIESISAHAHNGVATLHWFIGHNVLSTSAENGDQIQVGLHIALALSSDIEYHSRVDGIAE